MLEKYDPENPPFLLQYKVENFFTQPEEFYFEIRGVEYSVNLARYKHSILEPFPYMQGVEQARRIILKAVVRKDHWAEALMMCSRYLFHSHLDLWLDAVSYIDERAVEAFPYWEEGGEDHPRADPKIFRDMKYYTAVYKRFVATLFTSHLTEHVKQQLQTVKKPEDITVRAWDLWFGSACRVACHLPEGKVICKDLLVDTAQRTKLLLASFPESWTNKFQQLGHDVSKKGCHPNMINFMMMQEKQDKDAREQSTILDNIRQRLQAKIWKRPFDNNTPSPAVIDGRRRRIASSNKGHHQGDDNQIHNKAPQAKILKCQLNNTPPSPVDGRRLILISNGQEVNVAPRRIMDAYLNRSSMLTARPSLTNNNSTIKHHSELVHSTNNLWSDDLELIDRCYTCSNIISPTDFAFHGNPISSIRELKVVEGPPSQKRGVDGHHQNAPLPPKLSPDTNSIGSMPASLDDPIPRKSLPSPDGQKILKLLQTRPRRQKRPKEECTSCDSSDDHDICVRPKKKKKKKQKYCLWHNFCWHSTNECRDVHRLCKQIKRQEPKRKRKQKK